MSLEDLQGRKPPAWPMSSFAGQTVDFPATERRSVDRPSFLGDSRPLRQPGGNNGNNSASNAFNEETKVQLKVYEAVHEIILQFHVSANEHSIM